MVNENTTKNTSQCCPFTRNHLFGMQSHTRSDESNTLLIHTTFAHTHKHISPEHESAISATNERKKESMKERTNEWTKNKFPFGSFYLGCYQNTLDKLYHSSAYIYTHVLHQRRNQSVKMKLI